MKRLSTFSAAVSVSILAFLAVALAPAAAAPKPPSASATVQLPSLPGAACAGASEVTGLYSDGGIYGPDDGVSVNKRTADGGLQPSCANGRQMNLLLPAAARAFFSNAPIATCGRIWLTLPGLLNAQAGQVLGAPAPGQAAACPPNSSTGDCVFVYFVPDTNGDGEFGPIQDGVYNVRWQKGVYVRSKTISGNQTTFVLGTTDSLLGEDLSDDAELVKKTGGDASQGFYCVPLDLTVVVTQ